MISKPKSDPPECSGSILALQDALEIFGGKWRLLIIHYLITREDKINTFKKTENDITGISAKMLSKELKVLETNHIIKREVQHSKPVTVQYAITAYGKKVQHIITSLVDWGQNHRTELFHTKQKGST